MVRMSSVGESVSGSCGKHRRAESSPFRASQQISDAASVDGIVSAAYYSILFNPCGSFLPFGERPRQLLSEHYSLSITLASWGENGVPRVFLSLHADL
jgi:hypothetical protein